MLNSGLLEPAPDLAVACISFSKSGGSHYHVAMRALLVALFIFPTLAIASEALVPDLEKRLRTGGIESVNSYLSTQPSMMAALNQSAADCDPQAIDLAVKLNRGKNSKATDRHRESLRIAVGGCAEFVLSLLTLNEVPKICASASSWTVSQMARELRRRRKEIETDESLRSTPRGKACSAAYLFELQNTRVGLTVGRPNPAAK